MGSSETVRSQDERTIVVEGASSVGSEVRALRSGESLGRYEVVEQLGMGGMGVVYRACDPQLQREVALKVLRLAVGRRDRAQSEARLLREAQAMAQLSHPNVLPVFDVDMVEGTDDGIGDSRPLVFIAMEYVEGQTLEEWLEASERSWREVLSVMIPAGRGLAAAHAAAMVHRDFKPANVLIGRGAESEAGRVRVMDFGLARWVEDTSHGTERPAASPELTGAGSGSWDGGSLGSLDDNLTAVGTVVGTPAYMSPEHHAGRPLDARSDVYSFCVTLYEALAGRRPFEGSSSRPMLKHKLKGPPEFPPDRGGPSWLQRACLRGLQPKPEHRWASMDELLSTLERNLDGARRRMTLTAASAGLVVLGGLSVWTMAGAPEDPCKHAGEGIEQVWNLRRHQEVHDTLAALQRPYLDEIVPRLDGDLDAYASDWTRARVAACEANQDRSDHSPQMLDRAMACLDQRRDLLRATVDALAGAKEESVARKAVRAAMQLPPIDTCSDEAYLQTTLPPLVDPERAETAAEIRSGLADVRALGETGQVEAARELARDLARRAATLDYPPVDVEARARLGEALHDAGRFEESRDVLIPTYFDALEIGHDRQAASIASLLVFVVGKNLSRTEEARGWAQHADALLERFDDDGRARARFVLNLGSVALEAAEYDVALEHYRRALELHEKLFGEEDPRTAMVHSNIGIVLERHKQLDAAIEEYRRSIELYEASLGKDYPDLAMPLVNIGSALSSKGDFEAARVHLERALAIWEHSIGPDHPHVATVLNNIGTLLQDQGRNDEALGFHERALDIRTRVLGPEHPDVAMSLNNLGNIRRDQGDLAGSERDHRRALEIRSNALGEDHPLTATSAYNLGLTVLEQGKPEQAQALVERSIEIWRARLGPQHPYVAVGLQGLASIAIERGDLEQAQAHLQQSLAVLEQTMGREHFQVAETLTTLGKVELDQGNAAGAHAHLQRALQIAEGGTQPQLLARVAFALARTEAARGNLSVAKQRARQALSAYESVDDEDDARAAVERWLAEH